MLFLATANSGVAEWMTYARVWLDTTTSRIPNPTPWGLDHPRLEYIGKQEDPLQEANIGGKGSFTQWVHGEFFVSSETICLVVAQQAHGEFF